MKKYPQISDSAYRIESELGSGGGGVVYKVWHTRLEKYVVLKELKRGTAHDIEIQRNEVEALKNVKSAYLPQVLDFLTEDERIFTVMEFIEGESLDKLLKSGQKFSGQQVVKWYNQLSSALESIHKQNVCHRDIKPANIMLTPSGDVCLIDFNAALVGGKDVRIISRSLGYASPEQYEIYEQFKNKKRAPIKYGSSNIVVDFPDGEQTDIVRDYIETDLLRDTEIDSPYNDDNTDISENSSNYQSLGIGSQDTEFDTPASISDIDWKRSDIYSLGSSMYHLLSGKHPPKRAAEVIPLSKLGKFSEGIVYVIEQSMRINPLERFESATILSEALKNIHKHDTRWKISQSKKIAALIALPLAFILFASTMLLGANVMAQERETRFFEAVSQIEHGEDPLDAFNLAVYIFRDRIDPFLAMSLRLWNDGDVEATRIFIEENLGNIAQFQTVPEAAVSFGNIYFILASSYYFQLGEPNYHMARGYLEIATQFVTDNPIVFRDYAITLARTGDLEEAQRVLEQAQALGLESDSLDLLRGEISFMMQEHDVALENFSRVIFATGDDDLRYRAIRASDDIFRLLGQPERSIALLSDNLNRIPPTRVPQMTERLAEAHFRNGDFYEAIAIFEQLAQSGLPQFHIMQGLAILLHLVEDFDRAEAVLNQMLDLFPNDYRVPMRMAFLEAERQSTFNSEYRDYTLTRYYYEKALALYLDGLRPGHADAEMQQLSLIVEQLQASGWFD